MLWRDGVKRLAGAAVVLWLCAVFAGQPHASETAAADTTPHLAYAARIAGDEVRTRVVLDFDTAPVFSVHYLQDPARVIIDLPETEFGFPDDALEARGLFDTIRYGAMGPGRSRMVLTAKGPVELEMAKVEAREGGSGHRFVFDAVAASQSRFDQLVSNQSWQNEASEAGRGDRLSSNERDANRPFTVVIDPGHGGIDSGARGTAGTEEKDVTLAFSREIARQLSEIDNIRVVLTREDDRFLSLSARVRIARQHEADLMLSVHADSIRLANIRGATVYTLSDRASDRVAAELARSENRADEVAGLAKTDQSDDVADILLDLTRRETQVFSVGLARSILDSLKGGDIRLINNPHRFAGFSVLRAPDVPSLLVELGYLSNSEDEKLLTDPDWRKQTASLLVDAIRGFRARVFAEAGDL